MLSTLFPKACRRYTSFPVLGSLADAFDTWLVERGFRPGPRKQQLGAIRRIDRALRRRGRLRPSDVTHDDLEACWRRARRRGATDPASVRNLQRFLEHRALLPPPAPPPVSGVEVLTDAYAGMLRDLRGLAPTTVHQHVTTARAFLDALVYETAPARLSAATATDVERFVRDAGTRLSRASLQHTVAHLAELPPLPGRTRAGSAPAWISRSIRPVSTGLNSCHAASRGPPCRPSCGPSTGRPPRGCATTRCSF